MANHEELISRFKDVTGAESERAQFYLESSAWQLDVALSSFYENDEPTLLANETVETTGQAEDREDNLAGGVDRTEPSSMESNSASKAKSKPKATFGTINDLQSMDGGSEEEESQPTSIESKTSKVKSKPKPRFSTINDLQNMDNSSEEEEGQAFYAGGSAHSGQQVLGPGKKNDIISDMFKSCQEQSIAIEPKAGGQQRPNTFGGTGYKLGQTNSDTEVVSASQSDRQSNSGVIVLKLWRDGFTLNDGDIRPYSEPENREFLQTIKRGEIPAEIRKQVQSGEVRLDAEDHHHEEYVPPKHKVKAFTGKGHMLGSPSPAVVGMTVPTDPGDQAANESQATTQLNVDSTKPVTTIQIRLADGSTIRAQFNLTHTISDLRRFIITMRPQYAMRDFSLLTMYPTKELAEDKTIEEAELQNSAIIQRLK